MSAGGEPRRRRRVPVGAIVLLVLALGALGFAAYLALTFKLYRVPQAGMYPTIAAGDLVVARRSPYASVNDIARGDIVVFETEKEGKRFDYVFRVVGLPSERIAIVDDVLVIDDVRLGRERLRSERDKAIYSERAGNLTYSIALPEPASDPKWSTMKERKLGPDEVFLMGDNRHASYDSRELGPVKLDRIVGRVVWP